MCQRREHSKPFRAGGQNAPGATVDLDGCARRGIARSAARRAARSYLHGSCRDGSFSSGKGRGPAHREALQFSPWPWVHVRFWRHSDRTRPWDLHRLERE
jgi:hypothetical protein